MLNWYFSQTNSIVWLSTSPKTRAEVFYTRSAWVEVGTHGKDEIKFEMTFDNWKKYKKWQCGIKMKNLNSKSIYLSLS
jgi:hypothetical protein